MTKHTHGDRCRGRLRSDLFQNSSFEFRHCFVIRDFVIRNSKRRGAIFIVTLGITVVLSAMLLVFVQEMRTESVLSANRLASAQTDAVEQGAEQWVMAQLEANIAPLPANGAVSSTTNGIDPTTIPAEALQVGGGYFWLLHPDPLQDQLYHFGLVDECSKLNLKSANATQLVNLPGVTQDIATNIVSWPGTASANGALTYETVEELMMVDNMKEMTPLVLYGYDLNHDGVIDANERSLAGGSAITNGTNQDSRGLFNFITTYSTTAQPNTPGTITPTVTRRGNAVLVTPQTNGLINVNTAPLQVLMCIPGLSETDAQTLISTRAGTQTTGTAWVATALNQAKAQAIAPFITGTSFQYSADIVAVSGDARAFKRVRIVVDARSQPARILYRKDLTSLGFPLPDEVRTSLRSGKGVPADVTGTSNVQTSSGFSN